MKVTFINRMMSIHRGGGEFFDLNIARAIQRCGVEVKFIVGRELTKNTTPLEGFDVKYIKTPYLRWIEYMLGKYKDIRLCTGIGWRIRYIDNVMFENAALKFIGSNDDSEIYQICAMPRLGAFLSGQGKKVSIFWPGPPVGNDLELAKQCNASITHGTSYIQASANLPMVEEINPGADTLLFSPDLEKYEKHNLTCNFIFVGRCIEIKNLDFLIEGFTKACEANKNLKLTVVGDGASLPGIKKKVSKSVYRDKIQFTGTLNQRQLASSYSKSDVFVLVSKYESFSIATLEAMSSGLPVILSNAGYLPTFINQYNAGSLVETGDVDMLAEVMLYWAENHAKCKEVGLRNRQTVIQNYSWDKSAEKLIRFYEKIISDDSLKVFCNNDRVR